MNTQYASGSKAQEVKAKAEATKATADAIKAVAALLTSIAGSLFLFCFILFKDPDQPTDKKIIKDCNSPDEGCNAEDSTMAVVQGLCRAATFPPDTLIVENDSLPSDSILTAVLNPPVQEITQAQKVNELIMDWQLEMLNQSEEKKLESITNKFMSYNSERDHVEGFNSLVMYITTKNRYDLIDTELLKYAEKYPKIDKRYNNKNITLDDQVVRLLKLRRKDQSTNAFEVYKLNLIRTDQRGDSLVNAFNTYPKISTETVSSSY